MAFRDSFYCPQHSLHCTVSRKSINCILRASRMKPTCARRKHRREEDLVHSHCSNQHTFHNRLRFSDEIIFSQINLRSGAICWREIFRSGIETGERNWNTISTFASASIAPRRIRSFSPLAASRISLLTLFLLTAIPTFLGTETPILRPPPFSPLTRNAARIRRP